MIYFIPCIRNGRKAPDIMAKRGPKKKNVAREPNGRALRTIPEPADEVALSARAKHLSQQWGIKDGEAKVLAKDPFSSTFVGTLQRLGQITKIQYDASQTFLTLTNQERKRTNSALAHYEASETLPEIRAQEDIDASNRALQARYIAMQKAIQQAQNYQRGNLWAALQMCVVDNRGFEHMIGDLRLALNALDLFFNGVRARKAA